MFAQAYNFDLDSNIVSASALGTTLVVINSHDIAVELLEKRAAKYSSRQVRLRTVYPSWKQNIRHSRCITADQSR